MAVPDILAPVPADPPKARLRDRVATALVRVSKVFGSAIPPEIAAAEQAAQMGPASPFSPGLPLSPYDGYSRTPRSQEYLTGRNINARPRSSERVAFSTLQGLIDSYDVANACCAPGTRILTKRGLLPIENVEVGDEVITHLGRWRTVTKTMVNQPHTAARLLRARGLDPLVVTGNHPVYAVDYRVTQTRRREARGIGWVSADRLTARGHGRHDGMVLPALTLADERPKLDLGDLLGEKYRADADGMLCRARGGRLTATPAKVSMDAALGRILGWYLAEGSQGKGRSVVFVLGPSERAFAEQIAADLHAVFGLNAAITDAKVGRGLIVTVHSRILAALFACGTARTKMLPAWAWTGGREFFTALLDAWSLGDGHVHRAEGWSGRVTVRTSSPHLAWHMRMIAIALGLKASVATVVATRRSEPAVIRGKAVNSAPVSYTVAWGEKPQRWGVYALEFNDRYLATSLTANDPDPYDGPVYNLEVDEDHSYVTTGGTVHNCIWHRIDSIRSLDWSLVAADGHTGDVSDAVALGQAVLRKPDGETPFSEWLAEWLFDILAYDAGSLWRMRNRAGQVVGLRVVEGPTIAPLLDYWGNTPAYPAPAYVQYANGLPWNWLTTRDLIYRPFRKRTGSPYGRPPLEQILLNANTDIRFQLYFLQRFTDGNIPAAFASAPDTWTPQQIEQFQTYWDSFILGDQAAKSQVKWIPGGSRIEFTNEREFTDAFSLFLLRKTAMAYHVVPADLGLTESVNKSSGETQTDVQHRIGDVPLARHLAALLTAFLRDDLHLPVTFEFDFGEEQDDRYVTAQADQIYIQNAVVSPSEIRQLRYGKGEPDGRPVPRYIFSTRGGAVPLDALFAVAGPVDPESAAPLPGAALPREPFSPLEGVEPNPAPPTKPLAIQIYGEPGDTAPADAPVAKDGTSAGISAATGITSYDLAGRRKSDDEGDEPRDAVEKEMALFRRHAKNCRRAGRKWKDFQFAAIGPVTAHRLNDAGRLAVRKAAGQIAVAGLAVRAADTGRVLMLQRALDPEDPAAGTWEFPGGHLEQGETPLAAALREWSEEVGQPVPDGAQCAQWTSGNGIYRGIVWAVASEDCVPVDGERDQVANPDDPDGDQAEAIAWFDPAHLAGNPAVRPELSADLAAVSAALNTGVRDAVPA